MAYEMGERFSSKEALKVRDEDATDIQEWFNSILGQFGPIGDQERLWMTNPVIADLLSDSSGALPQAGAQLRDRGISTTSGLGQVAGEAKASELLRGMGEIFGEQAIAELDTQRGMESAAFDTMGQLLTDDMRGSSAIGRHNANIQAQLSGMPSMLEGGLAGAAGGFAAGGPIAAAIGGIVGAFGSSDRRKQLAKQKKEDDTLPIDEEAFMDEIRQRMADGDPLTADQLNFLIDPGSKQIGAMTRGEMMSATDRFRAGGRSFGVDAAADSAAAISRMGEDEIRRLRAGLEASDAAGRAGRQAAAADQLGQITGAKRIAGASNIPDPVVGPSPWDALGTAAGLGLGIASQYKTNKQAGGDAQNFWTSGLSGTAPTNPSPVPLNPSSSTSWRDPNAGLPAWAQALFRN